MNEKEFKKRSRRIGSLVKSERRGGVAFAREESLAFLNSVSRLYRSTTDFAYPFAGKSLAGGIREIDR